LQPHFHDYWGLDPSILSLPPLWIFSFVIAICPLGSFPESKDTKSSQNTPLCARLLKDLRPVCIPLGLAHDWDASGWWLGPIGVIVHVGPTVVAGLEYETDVYWLLCSFFPYLSLECA
jgi:hypothetical protein